VRRYSVAGILSNLHFEHADDSLAHSANLPHGRPSHLRVTRYDLVILSTR